MHEGQDSHSRWLGCLAWLTAMLSMFVIAGILLYLGLRG